MGPFDYPAASSAAYAPGAADPAFRKMRPPSMMPPSQIPPSNGIQNHATGSGMPYTGQAGSGMTTGMGRMPPSLLGPPTPSSGPPAPGPTTGSGPGTPTLAGGHQPPPPPVPGLSGGGTPTPSSRPGPPQNIGPGPGAGWVDAGYGSGPLINGFQHATTPGLSNDAGMAPPSPGSAPPGPGLLGPPVPAGGQPGPPAYGQPWQSSVRRQGNPYAGLPMPVTRF